MIAPMSCDPPSSPSSAISGLPRAAAAVVSRVCRAGLPDEATASLAGTLGWCYQVHNHRRCIAMLATLLELADGPGLAELTDMAELQKLHYE